MKLGSLFSGYGGLDLAVQAAIPGAETVWVSDVEPGPNKILTERFPGVPNLGDITTIDWDQVGPVDILAGGSPCQDLSSAGQRAGMKPGTRSGLWESMTHAINHLQPRLVVWENVLGALSASAYSRSDVEPGTGPMGNEPGRPLIRALGRVLGDLTNLGYDAQWATVRASDVGAPHQRARLFVVAYPHGYLLGEYAGRAPEKEAGQNKDHGPAHIGGGSGAVTLLPTPTVGDKGGAKARSGDGFGPPLGQVTVRIAEEQVLSPAFCLGETSWGEYAPAIRHWEKVFGRAAPSPTEPGAGRPRLSAKFVEWMMGLPEGWVTDIPISRARQLRALGNGVVPQQGAAAITHLLARQEASNGLVQSR